jgi:hypothetical protein
MQTFGPFPLEAKMKLRPLSAHRQGTRNPATPHVHGWSKFTFACTLATALAFLPRAEAGGNLVLEKALPLEGAELLQPSGLTWTNGSLLLVSCKHDDQVFQVAMGSDKATYQEAFRIARPPDAGNLKFTWRGMASDENGHLFLLSESAYRVLQVDKKGNGEWFGPSVLDAGTEIGLFGGDNSGPDGIARLSANRFLIGASRDPRGFISLTQQGEKFDLKPQKCEKSLAAPGAGRRPDFTDLCSVDGKLYALEGATSSVCALKENGNGEYEESECWSFASTTQDPSIRYKGLKDLARGLAVDKANLYIALDNKGITRESDPKDRRPLLLVFKRP